MTGSGLGALVYAFFEEHLKGLKAVRAQTIKSYRDTLRLFLNFVAADARRRITRLTLEDLTFERTQAFLRYLEHERGNHVRTRNQRLAALHTFFDFVATRHPETLIVAERVAAIPTKRVPPPETHFLEREEIAALFKQLPSVGPHARRDRALLLFLYNTGARVQEVVELRRKHLELNDAPRVRLHGKGDKWRVCPLWAETAKQLRDLLHESPTADSADRPVFVSRSGQPLTRFGIYKLVRRHTRLLERTGSDGRPRHISPHVFRHTTAVHLLEAGVEINVIRGWLGHAHLDTTNRYAEITLRTKRAALQVCEPPDDDIQTFPRKPVWRDDHALLEWLDSL
ncbi:MAG: integrase [Myxococcales bacterium]|nr:MAG: integrase [Myxococcales bacterium]